MPAAISAAPAAIATSTMVQNNLPDQQPAHQQFSQSPASKPQSSTVVDMADPEDDASTPTAPTSSLAPGPRAQALTSIFNSALSHTISTCSYENFSACFPTPATHAPLILTSVHRQITTAIEERAKREFEEILEERDVVRSLAELERLVAEARGRREGSGTDGTAGGLEQGSRSAMKRSKTPTRVLATEPSRRKSAAAASTTTTTSSSSTAAPIPPHALDPQALYLATLSPFLSELQAQLEEEDRVICAENERLTAQIREQERDVEGLLGGVERLVGDLKGANGVLGGEEEAKRRGEGEWARKAVEVDVEMSG